MNMESILEGTQSSIAYGGERFETLNRADNAGPARYSGGREPGARLRAFQPRRTPFSYQHTVPNTTQDIPDFCVYCLVQE
jgi:hypothetical protein